MTQWFKPWVLDMVTVALLKDGAWDLLPSAVCLLPPVLTPGVSTIEGCVLRLGMEKLKDRYQSWIWPHKMETEAAMYVLWNSRHLGGVWVKGGFSLRGPRR